MKNGLFGLVLAAAVVALVLWGVTFTVAENEFALCTHFGRVVGSGYAPGLHWKSPLDRIHKLERRIVGRSYPGESMLSSDGRALTVDFYLRWRVTDPQRYFAATAGDEDATAARLADIMRSDIKAALAAKPLTQVLSAAHAGLADAAIAAANSAFGELGTALVGVELQRVDLADDVAAAVYQRMQESYLSLAKQQRATGSAEADTLRAEADRKRTEVLASATRDAQRLRGEGDAAAAAVYARAYGRNTEFAAFYRSLAAYRNALGREGDVLVISPDGEFFKYLHSSGR
jgi:membrane protease subunit HflC